VRLGRLPEREVPRILLEVARLLGDHVIRLGTRERTVLRIGRDAEIHVTTGLVGEPALDQILDERDDFWDDLGGARLDVGAAEAEITGVLDVPLGRLHSERFAPDALACGRLVDLVVDVRDVLDELDRIALLAQPPAQPHGNDERARVPDVDPLVDRGAADVHANRPRRRRQPGLPAREGVVQQHGLYLCRERGGAGG
jgi:hypothetical protein